MATDPRGQHSLEASADLENFVAELTEAAYPVALRHKADKEWLALELDLWKTLTQTVKNWQERQLSPLLK